MKLFRARNQTPKSSPPSSMAEGGTAGEEHFVWEVLVPRLLYPSRLALIRALLQHHGPMSLSELAAAAAIGVDEARYHCKAMQSAGVLEIVRVIPRPDGKGDEPSYYFSIPPQASSPSAASQ